MHFEDRQHVLLKRLFYTHQSDKQKEHFIKCPFVFEVPQEYNDTGNVLEVYCLNNPPNIYKSRENLDGQGADLPSAVQPQLIRLKYDTSIAA